MWTPTTRRQYSRDGLRYETDVTDAEWALIEPLLPEPHARGRPRRWPAREILNAIFYVLRGGIAWRLLPSDLPPKSTVFRWFSFWRDTGLFETLRDRIAIELRVVRTLRRGTNIRDRGDSILQQQSGEMFKGVIGVTYREQSAGHSQRLEK